MQTSKLAEAEGNMKDDIGEEVKMFSEQQVAVDVSA